MHLFGDNGIITQAQMASVMPKFAAYKEEFEMNALDDTEIYASGKKIKNYIPSMDEQDIDKFVIMKSKLLYIATNDVEMQAAQKLGLGGISGELSASGATIKEIQNIISGVIELKNVFEDKIPSDDSQLLDESEHTNTADGLIGTRLFDRNSLNMANHTWNILDEYNSNNEKTDRYGTGYYWLKKGVTYIIDGESIEFKNNYVVDYSKNEFIVLSERAVNWSENSTLAATDGLVLNVDPMSLANGSWINSTSEVYDSTKTYEYELALANAIQDEETREAELNKVREENFYNFWVQNPITGEWNNTGTQKKGDVEYDSTDKMIKLNVSETNLTKKGGYLKVNGGEVDFSNGFTFEIFARVTLVSSYDKNIKEIGFFSRRPETNYDYANTLRFVYVGPYSHFGIFRNVDWLCRFSSFSELSQEYSMGEKGLLHQVSGNVQDDNSGCFLMKSGNSGIEIGKDFYMTISYSTFEDANADDFMKSQKCDKFEYYINGELIDFCYCGHRGFIDGISHWNTSDNHFYIGESQRYDVYKYFNGYMYTTRLYNGPITSTQVKDNYDMTLKYRSSF